MLYTNISLFCSETIAYPKKKTLNTSIASDKAMCLVSETVVSTSLNKEMSLQNIINSNPGSLGSMITFCRLNDAINSLSSHFWSSLHNILLLLQMSLLMWISRSWQALQSSNVYFLLCSVFFISIIFLHSFLTFGHLLKVFHVGHFWTSFLQALWSFCWIFKTSYSNLHQRS